MSQNVVVGTQSIKTLDMKVGELHAKISMTADLYGYVKIALFF